MVNEANNLGDAVVDRETEQGMKPIADPFFENVERMPPRRELEAELEKWKRRALTFQEAYRDKSFEVTSLEIQLMDLRAHGADVVTARQNKSLRDKLVAVCFERNLAMKVADAPRRDELPRLLAPLTGQDVARTPDELESPALEREGC